MEILKPVDDTTKRPCLGRCSPKMSVSGPNASSRPSKAFHFGLLDVPHSELFPSANDTASQKPMSRSALDTLDAKSCRGGSVGAHRTRLPGDERRSQERTMGPPDRRQNRGSLANQQEPSASCQYKRPIRPTAISLMQSGDSEGRSPRHRTTPASMGLEVSKLEGSATSDEHPETSQSRLIPKKGAGPDLRSKDGGRIDEYLMRLLRTGFVHADAPPLQQGSDQRGSNAWQGSRLGPLAPGAGIKSSSVRVARLEANPAAPANPPISSEADLTASERAGNGKRMAPSSATPLGASGATLPQADHGTHSRRAGREGLATGLEGANEAAAAASRDGSGHALGSQTPEAGFTGLGNTMKRMLGEHQWQHAQSRIKLQAQEFDLQLKELHRVAEVQSRLHPCGSATAGPASADSHSSWQQASLNGHSFSGLHPEKQRPKNAWWLNSGAWDPSLAIGLATWQPSVSEALPTSQRKPCPPVSDKTLSRTTRIALDAQRARRGIKNRARSVSKAGEKSQLWDDRRGQATGLAHSSFRNPNSAQSQNTWLERLQPYAQQDGLPKPGGAKATDATGSQSVDPLIGWYQYHFNQAPTHENNKGLNPPAPRGMQFAGLSLASPDVGWENQCQDFFNYSMTGTSEMNTAGQSSLRMAQRAPGVPRLVPSSSKPNE